MLDTANPSQHRWHSYLISQAVALISGHTIIQVSGTWSANILDTALGGDMVNNSPPTTMLPIADMVSTKQFADTDSLYWKCGTPWHCSRNPFLEPLPSARRWLDYVAWLKIRLKPTTGGRKTTSKQRISLNILISAFKTMLVMLHVRIYSRRIITYTTSHKPGPAQAAQGYLIEAG